MAEEGTVHSDLVFRQGVHIEKNLPPGSINQRVWLNEPLCSLSSVRFNFIFRKHNRIIGNAAFNKSANNNKLTFKLCCNNVF